MTEIKYVGRIKLSKEDSAEWYDNPEYMYVTDKGNRMYLSDAKLFGSLGACKRALSNDFIKFHHNKFDSKMEVLEIEMAIKSIKQI